MHEAQAAELLSRVKRLEAENTELKAENESIRQRLEWLLRQVFGRKSEKAAPPEQPQLFDTEADGSGPDGEDDEPEATVTVETHTRAKTARKPIPGWVQRREVLIDIDGRDKRCACGHELVRIGEEVSEKLDVIPAQFVALRIVRPKYACSYCEGSADEDKPAVRIAAMPNAIIERGMATPGLLAFVITAKYVDGLPLARQEKQFARMGIELSRKRLSDWVLAVGEALTPLIAELLHQLRSGPILLADETTVQVLGEPDRANTSVSYMWAGYGGDPRHPSVYFHYSERRSLAAAQELIGTYEGYLQTDAYEVYDRIAEGRSALIHVGCWAHARRKFFDAAQQGKKTGAAQAGLALIATLYQIEQELSGEPRTETFAAVRRERAQAALEKLHTWLEQKAVQVPPTTALGQAITYTLGRWEKLIRYLDHPELTPDTNRVENKIRPFVIGRKNWLFSGSPTGAQAAANLYSLIETAKANNLEPYRYLRALIERLPFANSPQDYRALLPQFIQIPTG